MHDLRVELPTSAEFLKTNFEDRALNEKIKAAVRKPLLYPSELQAREGKLLTNGRLT